MEARNRQMTLLRVGDMVHLSRTTDPGLQVASQRVMQEQVKEVANDVWILVHNRHATVFRLKHMLECQRTVGEMLLERVESNGLGKCCQKADLTQKETCDATTNSYFAKLHPLQILESIRPIAVRLRHVLVRSNDQYTRHHPNDRIRVERSGLPIL